MNLYYGSQGDDVRKLQKKLNESGYQLDEDGIYGSKTADAVRDYQGKNGLTVDGIVGSNTSGKLYGGAAELPVEKPAAQTMGGYKPSQGVTDAQAEYDKQKGEKPSPYVSQWDGQIQALMDQIMGRPGFSYNPSDDPAFQQSVNRAVQLGQGAMMDTMGQAAGLTGGYGNSYAQGVGQQTYQQYILGLNDDQRAFQQMALDQYNQGTEDLLRQYGILADRENQDYGRYNDDYDKWRDTMDRLYNEKENAADDDYAKWRDQVADKRYEDERAEEKKRYEESRRSSGPRGPIDGPQDDPLQDPDNPKREKSPRDEWLGSLTPKMHQFVMISEMPNNKDDRDALISGLENERWGFTEDEQAELAWYFGITEEELDDYDRRHGRSPIGGGGIRNTANYLN